MSGGGRIQGGSVRQNDPGVTVVSPQEQSDLPHFMILIYEREVPGSVRAALPTVIEAHMRLPRQIAEMGGRIIAGNALGPASQAVSVRDNTPADGSLAAGEHTLAGYFIVAASDLDHAVWIGRMIPVADGWVEVRPVLMT